jgi:hypothetical protein
MILRTNHIGSDDECIKIYNPAKQELLKTVDNYNDASKFTGLSAKIIRIAAATKTRRHSPFLNMEVAFRRTIKK